MPHRWVSYEFQLDSFLFFVQIEDLFPANGISDISPVSAFRSNVQYGFMIGFKMDVNSLVVTESNISSAQSGLSRAYRFGSLYLRSSTIQGRGLRFFKGIGTCAYS